jgi:TonB-dependent siderophore receptor
MDRGLINGRLLAAILCIVALAHAGTGYAADTTHHFSIPSEDLAAALEDFGRQSGEEILFNREDVRGKTAQLVSGDYTSSDALSKLLAGSGLTVRQANSHTFVVEPALSQSSTNNQNQSGQPEKPPTAASLEEIVVTGRYEFLTADTSGATNLPLPIEQVPQSISLVSNNFIEAANLKTLGDIAEYTPGALNVGAQLNLASIIKLRGFTAGQAIDGVETALPSTIGAYEPDYAIFDRLEVVKGPSSVVYGVSSPGGLVNFVTKSATPDTPSYLLVQGGSWDSYRFEGQAAGALDAGDSLRGIAVAVQDHGDSFINDVSHTKTTLYAGINSHVAESVDFFVHGGFERFDRTSFDGVPTEADGSPAPLPRSFFMGAENMKMTTDAYHAETGVTWHVSDLWEVALKGVVDNSKTTGTEPYAVGPLTSSGLFGLGIQVDQPFRSDNWGLSLSSIYRLDQLGIKDSFVSVAVVRQDNRQDFNENLYAGSATASISDSQAELYQEFNAAAQSNNLFNFTYFDHSKTTVASVQTFLQPINPLAVLVGASYSKPEDTIITDGTPESASSSGQMSYRGAVTYNVLPKTYAYVSYSESFSTQVGLTPPPDSQVLKPLTGREIEAGLKFRSPEGRLLLTGALFQIDERNVGETTIVNGINYFSPVGQVQHRGVEFGAIGHIAPQWQINAGYAFLDPKITEATNSAAATAGQMELFLPRQTANIYSTYTIGEGVVRGLSFGGGIRYVGYEHTSYGSALADEEEGLTQTRDIPSYTLVDTTVAYEYRKWLVQLNARNLLNKSYFINNYQTLYYGNTVGAPFNIALSVRRSF